MLKLFLEIFKKHWARPFIRTRDVRWTYADLFSIIVDKTHALKLKFGIAQEDVPVIGLVTNDYLIFIVMYLISLINGWTIFPINLEDKDGPGKLVACNADIIICNPKLLKLLLRQQLLYHPENGDRLNMYDL